jgi:opacity protein-like surface antigen
MLHKGELPPVWRAWRGALSLGAFVLVLSSGASRAEARAAPSAAVEDAAQRRGTHFILELSGGLLTTAHVGPAFSAVVGAGGKPPGVPLRFYAITEVSYADGRAGARGDSSTQDLPDQRRYLDLRGGVRAYLPILGPVRLFADALVGGTYIDAQLGSESSPAGPIVRQGWKTLVALGGGLQVRFLRHLSVGLRSTVVLTRQDIGDMRALSTRQSQFRTNVMAGLTWHF